jgi:hypothetical protein
VTSVPEATRLHSANNKNTAFFINIGSDQTSAAHIRKAISLRDECPFPESASVRFASTANDRSPPMLLKKSLLRRGNSFDSLDK